jgi:hypothetical protein
MANTPDKPQMSDDERADLMAMIAAGRDLSPEMDKSLVESYAERREAQKEAQEKLHRNAVVPQQQSPVVATSGQHPAVAITGIIATVAIFIAIMLFTQGHGWWFIFPLFGIFGGWWGRNDHYRVRDARRAERYQMRADYYRARMGYPNGEDARRLPESAESDSGPLPPPTSVTGANPPASRPTPPASSAPVDQPPTNPAG